MTTLEQILATLGVVLPPTGAGIKAYLGLNSRITKLEAEQESNHEVVLVKLDAIADKIDIRCDALEHRVGRIERSMNGNLKG